MPQPRGNGKLERIVEPSSKRGYWLYLPENYVKADDRERTQRRWPLVMTFHGMKPFDNAYPQACEWQQEADRYGFVVVAPELRAPDILAEFPLRSVHTAFKSDEQATLEIMDHVFETTEADQDNVLATSWSSGGYMAHYMMNRHPDRFSCLAVRQSNFSHYVLDPQLAKRNPYHPVLIINTQNDFAICRKESREAVRWYDTHGYKNMFWVIVKDKGHERTPDMAADFFGRVVGVEPESAPVALGRRQVIDGNSRGVAFLEGTLDDIKTRPQSPGQTVAARPVTQPRPQRRSSGQEQMSIYRPNATAGQFGPQAQPVAGASRDVPRTPAPAVPMTIERSPLSIRVSSAIGIEPLHLDFSAECPVAWHGRADFLWTLNGQTIANGANGQRTITNPGEHTLGLLVVTTDGTEHRAAKMIRVIPRLSASSGPGGAGSQ